MRTLWREPLIHFIVLGTALFILSSLWSKFITRRDMTIVVRAAEIERQATIFAGENHRQPTDEDIQALIFAYIQEQALMREALRLGLDEDDTIIRRRLAQKMRFLLEDIDPPTIPDDAVLHDWFMHHQSEFTRPEKRSFRHIFLSPTIHSDDIDSQAQRLLKQVTAQNWKTLGDPFMMTRQYTHVSAENIKHLFGEQFSQALFALPDKDRWQGPIGSAFGLHLIYIDAIQATTIPDFATIKAEVSTHWQNTQRRKNNLERLQALVKKYRLVVEDVENSAGE